MNFNPRTREGCDTALIFPSCTHCHFNPRTREGCDYSPRFVSHFGRIISIHAPARGATPISYFNSSTASISIHAPARGATSDRVQRARAPRDFNPRTREGCDVSCLNIYKVFQSTHPRGVRHQRFGRSNVQDAISIHAPARGATPSLCFHTVFTIISIHAPARGATYVPII